MVAKLPVVVFPQELYVDQVGGFGNAVSVRLDYICVCRHLLLRDNQHFCNGGSHVLLHSCYYRCMYLTEKVRQDLLGQRGRHRAQLHGEGGNVESEGGHPNTEIGGGQTHLLSSPVYPPSSLDVDIDQNKAFHRIRVGQLRRTRGQNISKTVKEQIM